MSAALDEFDPTTPAIPHISASPLTAINMCAPHEKNWHPRDPVATSSGCAELERERHA
jgi:hypothetical protein